MAPPKWLTKRSHIGFVNAYKLYHPKKKSKPIECNHAKICGKNTKPIPYLPKIPTSRRQYEIILPPSRLVPSPGYLFANLFLPLHRCGSHLASWHPNRAAEQLPQKTKMRKFNASNHPYLILIARTTSPSLYFVTIGQDSIIQTETLSWESR